MLCVTHYPEPSPKVTTLCGACAPISPRQSRSLGRAGLARSSTPRQPTPVRCVAHRRRTSNCWQGTFCHVRKNVTVQLLVRGVHDGLQPKHSGVHGGLVTTRGCTRLGRREDREREAKRRNQQLKKEEEEKNKNTPHGVLGRLLASRSTTGGWACGLEGDTRLGWKLPGLPSGRASRWTCSGSGAKATLSTCMGCTSMASMAR